MIDNFAKVRKNLLRGARPSSQDVTRLANCGVVKIISLDEMSGEIISNKCKENNIEHIIIKLNPFDIGGIKDLLSNSIYDLLNQDKLTFVHCLRGKDRTGLLIAMARCIFDNWCCQEALKEAKSFGFGTGLDKEVESFYTELIKRTCGHDHDSNFADITEKVHDFDNMYRDESFEPYAPSWGPYSDGAQKYYPYDILNSNPEDQQAVTRESYGLQPFKSHTGDDSINSIPMVGVYDQNVSITNLTGPSLIGGGFV